MSDRRARPAAIGSLLTAWLDAEARSARPQRREGARAVAVLSAFPRLGAHVTAHARAVGLRGRTLFVEVDQPIWLTELGFLKKEMVARLNALVGQAAVEDVRLRLGPPSVAVARPEPRAPVAPPLPAPLAASLAQASAGIVDAELRTLIERAARAAQRRGPK